MAQQHGGVNCTQQLPQQLFNGCCTGAAGIVLAQKAHTVHKQGYLDIFPLKTLARNVGLLLSLQELLSRLTSNPSKRMLEVRFLDARVLARASKKR